MAVAARRERERTARREAILDATQDLIASEGYHGLRMDAVADAVELSKGTLYLYFENKDALCAAVATRLIDAFLPFLQGSLDDAKSGLDAIRALL
ncbi:MAG: helix-turn-helix domain-containing protein, partial [Polyangiales bacterium]